MEWKVLVNSQTIRDIVELVTGKKDIPEKCLLRIDGNEKVPDGYYIINDVNGELVGMGRFDTPNDEEAYLQNPNNVVEKIKEVTKKKHSPWSSAKNCAYSGVDLEGTNIKAQDQLLCHCGRVVTARTTRGGGLMLAPHYTDAAMSEGSSSGAYANDQYLRHQKGVKAMPDNIEPR